MSQYHRYRNLSQPGENRSLKYWFHCFVLIATTTALYSGVMAQTFVHYDDGRYVSNNLLVSQGISWEGILTAFTSLNMEISYWHPLTWISHQLDCELFGLAAGWHKATNVLLHCYNTILIYCLFHRFHLPAISAFTVAALFAWHPTHVESVVWVSERKDTLSTLFALLALHFYLDYSKRPSAQAYLMVGTAFAFALMSKPMVVTLPFLMLLLDYWPLQSLSGDGLEHRTTNRIILEKIPLMGMSLAVAIVTIAAQQELGIIASREELPIVYRVANLFQSLGMYVWLQFFPTGLAALYPYQSSFSSKEILLALTFFVAMSTLAIKCRHQHPCVTFGWSWFLITLLPVTGLIQSSTQARADRYTYFSSLGLYIILVVGLQLLISRRRRLVFAALASLATVIYLPLTWSQIAYWKNSETLFRRAVLVTKDNSRMHRALGAVLDWDERQDEVEFHLIRAMEIAPTSYQTYRSLAEFYKHRKAKRKEIIHLHKSLFWNAEQPKLVERLKELQAPPQREVLRAPP